MDEITIEWRGPFSYTEVIGEEGKDPNERLYAIAWEPPKLLPKTKYIGSAIDQTIAKRLAGNHQGDEWLYNQHGDQSLIYFLGEIILGTTQIRSPERTLDTEAAIIFYHHTIEGILDANIQNTRSYRGRKIRIKHIGDVPPGIVDFHIRRPFD